MKINSTYLYDLLPAYYRVLDHEQGEPLKAFIEVLAREAGIVEQNIDQLYENWFIETCEEWVVPYIGELLGVRGVHQISENKVFSRRAYVANTLAYRRRKGTVPVIEQLAQDITGWRASAVEFFQLLSWTQHLNHLRLKNHVTPDLTKMNAIDLVQTPFEVASHTVEVGSIQREIGRYNISNLGVYLWRLNAYPLTRVNARKISGSGVPAGAYTFSPLGLDAPLFNHPQTEESITSLAKEINVPGILRRRGLHDELEAIRIGQTNGTNEQPVFFDQQRPVFKVYRNNNAVPVEQIVICNLSDWRVPVTQKHYETPLGGVSLPIQLAVDPRLGRMVFNNPSPTEEILVDYAYGFSSDVGGGPYDRGESPSLSKWQQAEVDWHVGVSKSIPVVASETIYTNLKDAIQAWNALGGSVKNGLITIMDSQTYKENLTGLDEIKIDEGQKLLIVAADWEIAKDQNGNESRPEGTFNAEAVRPHLQGDITVIGTAPSSSTNGGSLIINGLLIEGNLDVSAGNLESFSLEHTTVVPGFAINIGNQDKIFELLLRRSIAGSIKMDSEDSVLTIKDSIMDAKNADAVFAKLSSLCIEESTIWGKVTGQILDASNCIFNELLQISRRQRGCVRFSYLDSKSQTPKRYRCQPELAIGRAQSSEVSYLLNRIQPTYNSISYGQPAYAQLNNCTPEEIKEGAENGAEMGVFNHLQQAQRISNLKLALEEYLRLGMETGLIFVT